MMKLTANGSNGVLLSRVKNRLSCYRPYLLARAVKHSFDGLKGESLLQQFVSLKPSGRPKGHVLFSYMIEGFVLDPNDPKLKSHTCYWQSVQMAKTFQELGYCVDVIDYRNQSFQPEKDYSVVVDLGHNLERFAPLACKDCLKISHADTAHLLFHNAAEATRLLALQQRRGVTLLPRRFEPPHRGIEHADCITTSGNEFTIGTYRYANKPIYPLPVPVAAQFPWPEDKDWNACRNRFLWLSSFGMVHKGLDLALEAFAEMPDCHLTICAPVEHEKDFQQAYRKELYETPNIHTEGWVAADGERLREIVHSCVGLVYTTCSEGGGASAIECMHMGLIPIVSREASVDAHDFGFLLNECTVSEIKAAVRTVSSLPIAELKFRARNAWEYARAHHTREKFAEEYRRVVLQILSAHGHQ
jgi:glycosyltransferase involved in cell wall biosynthesis